MKVSKLSVIVSGLLVSATAMASNHMDHQAAYQYDSEAGVVANTTGAVVGTTKTLFNTVTNPAAVSAEIGTLGYGANIAWGVNESTELVAGWTGASFDGDTELNANDSWINWEKPLGDGYGNFEGDLKYDVSMSNPYLGVKMRPFSNWMTVGAGVIVPRNEIEATLTPTAGGASEVTIDDVTYQVPEGTTVDMKVENDNKLAPYATIGFRPNINNKWGGFAEVGAAYMGDVKSDVTVKNGSIIGGTNEQFEEAAKNELNDNDSVWYPIAKVGLTYRF